MTSRLPLLPIPALLLAALAACVPPSGEGGQFPDLFAGPEAEEPPGPPPLPAAVLAALPPGVPASVVLQDGQGCYLYSIERTEPPSGYPLRDAAGNQVCDPGVAPAGAPIATVAGLAADVAGAAPPLVPPSPEAPALPPAPASGDDGPIDISPVLSAPLPDAAEGAADAASPGIAPPITPGSITPPAPLAPLN